MGERRSDTRERIQAVALELFAERGYDKTSLREIAERLDVTKAALYYHFRTKEDIVASLFENLITGMDEVIDWVRDQPRNVDTRKELIRRYAGLTRELPPEVMRFVQESRSTMRELAVGEKLELRLRTLVDLLTDPDAPALEQLKSAVALLSVNAAIFMLKDSRTSIEERDEAALTLALELVSGRVASEVSVHRTPPPRDGESLERHVTA
jgi:AcrR family transcriptional regulator